MELAAIVISVVALTVSVGHLLWTVHAWHRAGPQIEVELQEAVLQLDAARVDFLALIARNVGRAPVSIIAAGLLSETEQWLDLPNEPDYTIQPEVPYRIEGGEQIDWGLLFVNPLRRQLHGKGYRGVVPVWGLVNLGNGQRVPSKKPIQVLVPDEL